MKETTSVIHLLSIAGRMTAPPLRDDGLAVVRCRAVALLNARATLEFRSGRRRI